MGLRNITKKKANGSDGIPAELCQILKDDAVIKVLLSICQQNWKTQQWTQHQKMLVFIPVADSFWYMVKPIQYCKVK